MTVIDPFLDRSQNSAPARLESREMAMLRHDIRGALMGVAGAAGYLETAEIDAGLRPQVERLAAASRVLACLIEAALGEEPDPDEPRIEPRIEISALIAHLRRRYTAEAADRGLRFVAEAGEGAPVALLVDATALGRIIDNLVGNAIKFCQQGTIRLSLARGADGSVVIRVADDGPGLGGGGAQLSERAGEGLGLEIVRTLAERLGAEASIGNRPAGGVEAVLRFPPRVADDRPGQAETRPEADLTGIRVLLAEDNLTNQMVASQMLRALHAEVTVCADGIEALERFDQEVVDLVVVDIEMPRLSGLDVIRAIRARGDDRAQVPIVALTAYAMREHRERIAAAGANGLISKPITSVDELGRGLAVHVARLRPAALEASPADAEAPVIVRATYDALVEAIGADTMSELLDKVIADLLSAQRALAAALPGIDRAAIRSATHILISVAGAIGAARLQGCARELNAEAQSEAPGVVSSATRRCIAEIDAAVAFARDRRAAR